MADNYYFNNTFYHIIISLFFKLFICQIEHYFCINKNTFKMLQLKFGLTKLEFFEILNLLAFFKINLNKCYPHKK